MKAKLLVVALLASAAVIAPVQGGGYHGGGGGGGRGGGGNFAAAGTGPARSGGGPSFHSTPMRSFGGGRMNYSGQRFSSTGLRSPRSMEFHPNYVRSNAGRSIDAGQFSRGNISRGDRSTHFSNTGNRATANL